MTQIRGFKHCGGGMKIILYPRRHCIFKQIALPELRLIMSSNTYIFISLSFAKFVLRALLIHFHFDIFRLC